MYVTRLLLVSWTPGDAYFDREYYSSGRRNYFDDGDGGEDKNLKVAKIIQNVFDWLANDFK